MRSLELADRPVYPAGELQVQCERDLVSINKMENRRVGYPMLNTHTPTNTHTERNEDKESETDTVS